MAGVTGLQPGGSACENVAEHVIPSGARNLALSLFEAMRDSSSPAAPRNAIKTGVFTQTPSGSRPARTKPSRRSHVGNID